MRSSFTFRLILILALTYISIGCGQTATVLNSILNPGISGGDWPITGKAAAAGSFSSCAITNGAVKCWGSYQSIEAANTVASVFSSGAQAVSAGTYHECAVIKEILYCWKSLMHYSGTVTTRTPIKMMDDAVKDVSVGNDDYCALLKSGALKCSGRSFTNLFFDQPITVLSQDVTQVSVGNDHTCAVVAAALWCWGSNNYGQLGNGTTTASTTPIKVIDSGVTSVSAGISETCAVVSGAGYCWGSNSLYQLGDGTTTQRLSPGAAIIASGVTSIQAGYGMACAVANDSAYCWGKDFITGSNYSTTPKLVISSNVSWLSLTYNNHTCAIVSNLLYCWGQNTYGQIGDGTSNNTSDPKQVL